MKEIFEKIATTLNLNLEDVLNQFNLTLESKPEEFKKALGVYSIFETKDKHEEYINKVLKSKEQQISQLQEIDKENKQALEMLKNENELINQKQTETINKLNQLIKSEWQNLGIKRDFEKSGFDLANLDLSNIKQSLLNFAENEGYAINKPQGLNHNQDTTPILTKQGFKNVNGAITKE
ncbi:hypothetical protein [[Mycoplasma] anseris]|uniref:Uncharacterized protein n=1 Tax=[Mycoplasma] anseris TaxID=92400 RepID=A0A2Z4NDV5_9BACT|nr:hypothetical protein [[Mycoplasma] anseris]AWX69698.1 hypothetical protein DP065_03005 [[Mycoplasma] anseris]